nr:MULTISPECIES: hydroxyisourate hydrolase [unclassified Bradyrhizobium]
MAERPCFRLPWPLAHRRNGKVAGGISIHAVDVASGRPAQGLRIEIWRIDPEQLRIAEGRLGANGVLDHPVAHGAGVTAGVYEVLFHLGEFFADSAGFLTVTPFRFRITDIDEHFHLPLKFTRWGYSLFRGA